MYLFHFIEPHIVFYAGYPLKTFKKSVVGTLCVLDQKEKKLSESQKESLAIIASQVENLLESKDRFQGFVNNSSDVIYELDNQGNFVYLSPSITKMLGYTPDELLGKHFKLIVKEEDLPKCEAFLLRLLTEGEINDVIEYDVRHKDGHYEWHESKCSTPVPNICTFGCASLGVSRGITTPTTQSQLRAKFVASF